MDGSFRLGIVLLVLGSVLALGCGSTNYYQRQSGPATGCEPEDIKVVRHFGKRAWVAKCDKKKYYCTGPEGVPKCKEMKKK